MVTFEGYERRIDTLRPVLAKYGFDGFEAVSYTHLDVYKRQAMATGIRFFEAHSGPFAVRFNNYALLPYVLTHLCPPLYACLLYTSRCV